VRVIGPGPFLHPGHEAMNPAHSGQNHPTGLNRPASRI